MLSLLPAELDRSTTTQLVAELLFEDVASAFVVSMIWGHGNSGYGPFRTGRILTASRTPKLAPLAPTVLQQLTDSAAVAREKGAVEGYRRLTNAPGRIAGLGPAFFTKWLYFVTAAQGDNTAAAPVLDALIVRWLRTEAGVQLRPGRTADYEAYVELLREWGAPYDLAPVDVEERIFRTFRGDGAPAAATKI